mmetsp:Transcript_25685/g.33642  ORF Transcript_25685/g.33642 Transcript_25685/m.33642 type:complete len:179 (+) Transcript_25685:87-623(+)
MFTHSIKSLLLVLFSIFLVSQSFVVPRTQFSFSPARISVSSRENYVSMTNKTPESPLNTFNFSKSLITGLVCFTPAIAEAAAPEWVAPTRAVLDPFLNIFSVAMLARIVLSWYPSIDLNKSPQNFVAWPTEPLLKVTRSVIPPAFGVDISPIVWLMISSFIREITLGPQGILVLLSNK